MEIFWHECIHKLYPLSSVMLTQLLSTWDDDDDDFKSKYQHYDV
jgi:hypothetical protein